MIDCLITIIVVNAFVLFLCGLIVLCGRFFSPSGKVKLKCGDEEKNIDCGQTLLSACVNVGVGLPAACGGKGTCGKCALKVVAGGGKLTPIEYIRLTQDEINNGLRLACQIKVRQNIELDKSVFDNAASTFKARLIKSEKVADRIKILTFEYIEGKMKNFKSGQYVQVGYNLPWETVTRAYSISFANENMFSLDVQAVEGGLVSNYLHSLKEGNELNFSGSYGDMFLSDELPQKSILLAAGGVGLAPMRSIIDELIKREYKGIIYLFQGARNRSALYKEQFFIELANKHSNFKYYPALSEPALQDGWNGFEGMVHELIDKQIKDIEEMECFLCGPKPMMKATENILFKKGLNSDKIHSDPFDF